MPVNTSLLGLYEIASSIENKRDPWILFLYGRPGSLVVPVLISTPQSWSIAISP